MAMLFALRLWAAVCLALYVAFALELDNPSWAGTTAAIVCQPHLGASLRKGWFRMVGTAVGAVMIVVLTACVPQSRAGFLVGLALWGALCGFAATTLRNFAAYAAALAGYTAAIIAMDELGATGGASGQAFTIAVTRASEICIGIVCAGIVLAGTDFGTARRRLAAQFAAISAEITGGLAATFRLTGPAQSEMQPVRRDLIRRAIALDPVIDEAIGEASDLRYRSRVLQGATDGLFVALSGWRTIAAHLELLPDDQGRREAGVILRSLPSELRAAPVQGGAAGWTSDPSRLRRLCYRAVRALVALPAATASLRLLADRTAYALLGMARTLDGLTLLVANPSGALPRHRLARLRVPDWLPAVINAVRVFVTIGAVELFWIVTAWPNGATAIAFAAIGVILLSPRGDQAYAAAVSLLVGTSLAAVLAAVVKFAVLPGIATFAGFSIVMGLVLVPLGILIVQPWQSAMFTLTATFFIPLLGPQNQITFDTGEFYNTALAIVGGIGAAALSFRLLPPLSPAARTRRLLAATTRDLRRLATGPIPQTATDWESRVFSRLAVLPEEAEPVQRAWLVAALSVGSAIIRLRHIADRFDLSIDLDPALASVARGDGAVAIEHFARVERALSALPAVRPGGSVRRRARGSILAISEALSQYAPFFDAAASA